MKNLLFGGVRLNSPVGDLGLLVAIAVHLTLDDRMTDVVNARASAEWRRRR